MRPVKDLFQNPGDGCRRRLPATAGTFRWVAIVCVFVRLQCPAVTNYVSINESAFIPDQIAIYPGDTVTWTQDDSTEHSVTSEDLYINSGNMSPGDVFSFTFNEVGTFPYYCVFHGISAMAGVVTVSEPGENTPPHTPSNVSPPDNATNQPVSILLSAEPFSDPDPADFHATSQWIVRYANNNSIVVDSGTVTGNKLTNFSPAGLIDGTTYEWQVRYGDGRRGWSEYSKPTRFTTLVAFSEPGIGLRGSYYSDAGFTNPLVIVTNTTIDFDWGKTRPHRRVTTDDFAVRWEGSVLPRFSERYQFEFEFRGRARVWVKEELLIDDWTHSPFILARRVAIPLVAGQLVPVKIEYAADPQGATAILRWMSPSVPAEVIPTLRLFPPMP